MNRKFLILFLIFILFASCKDEILVPEKIFSYKIINSNVRRVSSVTLNNDGTVAAWSGNSNDVWVLGRSRLKGHIGTINSVKLNAVGSLVLSGSNDNNIKLWNVNTGTLLRTFSEHVTNTKQVTFSNDEKSVLSAEGNYIVYWRNAVDGFIAPLRMYGHTATVSSVVMSRNMKWIVSGSSDSTIKLWNAETAQLVHSMNANAGHIKDVKINPVSNQFASCAEDSTIRIWDLNTLELLKTLKKNMGKINSLSYHYSGNYIACGGSNSKIYIWDIISDSIVVTLDAHQKAVTSIEFCSSGDDLISGGADEKVIIWRNVFSKK